MAKWGSDGYTENNMTGEQDTTVRDLLANMERELRNRLARQPRPEGQREKLNRAKSKVQDLIAMGFTAPYPQTWPQDRQQRLRKYLTEIRPRLKEMEDLDHEAHQSDPEYRRKYRDCECWELNALREQSASVEQATGSGRS